MDRSSKIGQRSRETLGQLFRRHIVSTLRHAHGDSLFGNGHIRKPDETEDNGISRLIGLLEKAEFVAYRIREYGFKNETFALVEQFVPQCCRQACSLVGVDLQVAGNHVSVQKSQAAGLKMGFKERAFSSAIRPSNSRDDWPLIEIFNP